MRGSISLWGWVAGAMLALLALARGTGTPAGAGAPSAPPSNRAKVVLPDAGADEAPPTDRDAGRSDPCDEGTRLLTEYRSLYATPAPEAGAGDASDGGAGVAFRHLIALVPDPVESGYTDYFVSAMEGVEEAVAAGDDAGVYVRDRSWLPWPRSESDRAEAGPRCWERHPGVLLYRPPGDPSTTPALVVLLVGETPTWGVQAAQLEAALRVVDTFRAWWPAEGNNQYRILGPTFSGTAASLSAVMRGELNRDSKARFSVASGTATNRGVKSTVESAMRKGTDAGAGAAFWSATPDDSALLDAMLTFLCDRGAHCAANDADIALLSESLTTYGAAHDTTKTRTYWEFKFPPSLAPIPRPTVESLAAPAASSAAPTASPLSRGGHGTELSSETPVAHDLELGDVLRALASRRPPIRFLGIEATDAQDVVFLADRIRQQLPDVRLFTLSTDVRYLDPNNANALNGMLVAHSTPPPVGNGQPISLENEFVRNVFDAGRHLLTGATPKLGVRVSLIGNGAFWQIGPDASYEGGMGEREPLRVPPAWRFLLGFFVVVLAIVTGLVAAPWLGKVVDDLVPSAARRASFLRHRGALWGLVGTCEHADLRADDHVVTASLLTVAACPPILMSVSWFAREGDRPSVGMAWLNVGLVAAVLVGNLLYVARRWRPTDGASTETLWFAGVGTLASLLALGTGCGPQREATFNLLSGGSPVLAGLVGLTILGLGLWCWRVRLRFLDSHRFGGEEGALFRDMVPPIARALGESPGDAGKDAAARGTGLAEVESLLLRVIHRPWLSFVAVPAIVHALYVASIMIMFIKPPTTFEPGWRNWLLVAFGCGALLPVTGNLSRLLSTWIVFARFLRRLATFPSAEALGRLPAPLARPLDAQLGLAGNEVVDLACSVQALGRLSIVLPSVQERYTSMSDMLQEELRYEAGAAAAGSADRASGANRSRLIEGILDASSVVCEARPLCPEDVQARIDDFVATLIAVFVPRYVRHFRLFAPPLVAGSVLGILMTSLYFMEPQRLISSIIFVWVAAMVLAILLVYVALDRDPIISAIGKTPAGSVTWNWALVSRIILWGLFPMASLFAAQFPQFASWISAAFDVVAKGFR